MLELQDAHCLAVFGAWHKPCRDAEVLRLGYPPLAAERMLGECEPNCQIVPCNRARTGARRPERSDRGPAWRRVDRTCSAPEVHARGGGDSRCTRHRPDGAQIGKAA